MTPEFELDRLERDGLIDALTVAAEASGSVGEVSWPTMETVDALDVQLAVLDHRLARGARLGGWKIGPVVEAPPGGVGFRPFGCVMDDRVVASGESIALPTAAGIAVEPEICVVMGADLRGPAVTRDEAKAAVSGIAASFEICGLRVPTDAPLQVKIADQLGNWGIVVGEVVPVRDDFPEMFVQVSNDGTILDPGVAGPAMTDPFLLLAHLCATLDAHGWGLEAGQRVVTGAFSRHSVHEPGEWRAIFAGVGEVSITFT